MEDDFMVIALAEAAPGWELLGHDVDGCWYVWRPASRPAAICWGEDLGDLMSEIRRKDEILRAFDEDS
jgi:hypothetical protein